MVQQLSKKRVTTPHLKEGMLVNYLGQACRVRRVVPGMTRSGFHVHLLPVDFRALEHGDRRMVEAYEASQLIRKPCPAAYEWQLAGDALDVVRAELEELLEVQAEEIAPTCKTCDSFLASDRVDGVGTCLIHCGRVVACDKACSHYAADMIRQSVLGEFADEF